MTDERPATALDWQQPEPPVPGKDVIENVESAKGVPYKVVKRKLQATRQHAQALSEYAERLRERVEFLEPWVPFLKYAAQVWKRNPEIMDIYTKQADDSHIMTLNRTAGAGFIPGGFDHPSEFALARMLAYWHKHGFPPRWVRMQVTVTFPDDEEATALQVQHLPMLTFDGLMRATQFLTNEGEEDDGG